MSMVLADYILKHLEKLNLMSPGSTIIDFMAGQGTTGIIAELHGYQFIGIELEEHFIDLINGYDCNGVDETVIKTKDKDGKSVEEVKYGKCGKYNHSKLGDEKHVPHFMSMNRQATAKALHREPSWTIIQGDARKLSEILNTSGAGVISPPYGGMGLNYKQNGLKMDGKKYERTYMNSINSGYSAIVSPPYGQMIGQTGGDIPQDLKVGISTLTARKYSDSQKNIGNLKDSTVAGITSPPYGLGEGIGHSGNPGKIMDEKRLFTRYGKQENQIGNDQSESYLSAMLKVYQEAYKSGISPLCVVVKNPTKNHKLRRLDIDTIKLLEMSGYRIIDYHRAILFKTSKQQTLSDEIIDVHKGQISFFKRVSLQNGNVAAQWEDIIFAVRDE